MRRLWLPRTLYAALPFLYLLLGASALASGIWLPEPGWILGYLLLISTICLHAGIWFMLLRRRRRHSRLRRSRAARGAGTLIPKSPAGL
jgi:protein-S-isoprenylcysteine O-methyltransferase Ste14